MRLVVSLLAAALAYAQPPTDPAYAPLARAYESLKSRDYDAATRDFLRAIDAAPDRPHIRKDLAYTYLKVGENDLARAQLREAMRLAPPDTPHPLDHALLPH